MPAARAFLLPVLLAGLCAGAVAAPPAVEVQAHWEADAVLVHATAVLPVDQAQAWHVLSGYERYPAFLSDLRSSRVVARHGDTLVVQQEGVLRVLLFRLPVSAVLHVHEQPPWRITAQAVSGSFRAMSGSYDLEPVAGGLRFTYSGRVEPAFRVPAFLSVYAVRGTVERHFRELVGAILDAGGAGSGGTLRP